MLKVSVDTIPWVLLKAELLWSNTRLIKISVDTIPWVLLKEEEF